MKQFIKPLCKHTPMARFDIWEPLYSEKKVLLNALKVREHNKVVFTKARSMGTEPYYLQGKIIRKYGKRNNGTIDCFAVPLSELRPLEYPEHCEHDWK